MEDNSVVPFLWILQVDGAADIIFIQHFGIGDEGVFFSAGVE